jgi:hypothetical protein
LKRAGCRRGVRRAGQGSAAATDERDAGIDRICPQGGQGLAERPAKAFEAKISRHRRPRRALRRRTDFPAHRPGAGPRGCSRVSSSAQNSSNCWSTITRTARSNAQIKEKPGHPPLPTLKLLKSDPAAVLAQSEDIKARYAKLFKV